MNRRAFIVVGVGAALAGCTGGRPPTASTPTSTREPTPDPTDTPEPTETEATRPVVEFVNLVSAWDDFGDAESNAIDSVSIGEAAIIAYRETLSVHDGVVHATDQVRVFDSEDNRVGFEQYEDEQLTELTGRVEAESSAVLDTSEWPPGTHTAEVLIRDEITGEVSEPGTTEFEVVESVD